MLHTVWKPATIPVETNIQTILNGFKSGESGDEAIGPPLPVQVPVGTETEMSESTIMHTAQVSTNDQWHVSQEIDMLFVVQPCMFGRMWGPNKLSSHTGPGVDGEQLFVM
jgi:hypothetical protein